MLQYNLRLDKETKEKASGMARKMGLSENRLYLTAIQEYVSKCDAEAFYQKMMKRIVTSSEKKALLSKLKKNKGPLLFREDI